MYASILKSILIFSLLSKQKIFIIINKNHYAMSISDEIRQKLSQAKANNLAPKISEKEKLCRRYDESLAEMLEDIPGLGPHDIAEIIRLFQNRKLTSCELYLRASRKRIYDQTPESDSVAKLNYLVDQVRLISDYLPPTSDK